MNIIIDSQEKFIRKHIISEFKNDPEIDPESYSNIINYSIDELIKINIIKTARKSDDVFPEKDSFSESTQLTESSTLQESKIHNLHSKDILNESIQLTESSILQESEIHNLHSNVKKYFDNAQTKYGPLSNEISKLKQQLFTSKEGKRIGETFSLKTINQFPYEVGEIGLKDSIEGLILTPLLDSFQIDMGKVHHNYIVVGEWFPFEIKIDYLTFVLDDDGTIYVSTENYPLELMEKSKTTLKELASEIYSNEN